MSSASNLMIIYNAFSGKGTKMHPHSSVKKQYTKIVWGALFPTVMLVSSTLVGCAGLTEVVSRDLAKDVNFQVTELLPPEIAVNELRSLVGEDVREKTVLLGITDPNISMPGLKSFEQFFSFDDLDINCHHSSIANLYTGYLILIWNKEKSRWRKWQFGSNAKSTARACTALVSLGATLKPKSAGSYTTTVTEGVVKETYTP